MEKREERSDPRDALYVREGGHDGWSARDQDSCRHFSSFCCSFAVAGQVGGSLVIWAGAYEALWIPVVLRPWGGCSAEIKLIQMRWNKIADAGAHAQGCTNRCPRVRSFCRACVEEGTTRARPWQKGMQHQRQRTKGMQHQRQRAVWMRSQWAHILQKKLGRSGTCLQRSVLRSQGAPILQKKLVRWRTCLQWSLPRRLLQAGTCLKRS